MKTTYLLLVILNLSIALGVHLELSYQYLSDHLKREKEPLQALLDQEWTKEQQPYTLNVNEGTFKIAPGKEQKSAYFTMEGNTTGNNG